MLRNQGSIIQVHQRLRQVLKSQFNGQNEIHANNTYALPVIRYPSGIVNWQKEDMEAPNVKTQKLLKMYIGFYSKSNIQRLYTRKEVRWSPISIKTNVMAETYSIQMYQ